MNNKEIVERSREELEKASEWLSVGYDSDRDCVVIYYRDGPEIREPLRSEFVGEGESYINFVQHAHENLAACHAEIDRLEAQIGELGVALEVAQTNAIDFATGLVGWACICDKDIAKPSGRDGLEALQYLTSVGKAELVEPDGWYPYVVWRLL
jgi:hypothetical protein